MQRWICISFVPHSPPGQPCFFHHLGRVHPSTSLFKHACLSLSSSLSLPHTRTYNFKKRWSLLHFSVELQGKSFFLLDGEWQCNVQNSARTMARAMAIVKEPCHCSSLLSLRRASYSQLTPSVSGTIKLERCPRLFASTAPPLLLKRQLLAP